MKASVGLSPRLYYIVYINMQDLNLISQSLFVEHILKCKSMPSLADIELPYVNSYFILHFTHKVIGNTSLLLQSDMTVPNNYY